MNQTAPPLDTRKTLATQIYAVTVYTDQALVTRRGTVTLTGEEKELAIALLPQSQQELSYQFTVEHPPDITIIGLDM